MVGGGKWPGDEAKTMLHVLAIISLQSKGSGTKRIMGCFAASHASPSDHISVPPPLAAE